MAGIVSFGAYLPRLRLNRMEMYKAVAWLAPGLLTAAKGERTMCNWDEDALTMAVAAARDSLTGEEKARVEAVYLASTTLPFADRSNAGVLAAALNLREEVAAADFTGTQKAGTSALAAGLAAVKSGNPAALLVTAADRRRTKAAWFHEMWFGDGAAAFVVGRENVIAEHLGSFSVSQDFVDHYRGADEKFDYNWEERWIRDEGYLKIIPQAVNGLLSRTGVLVQELAKVIYPCYLGRAHDDIGKALKLSREQIAGNLQDQVGECGTAHPLLMLAHQLETAKPGDLLLVVGFGQGADALLFKVTERLPEIQPPLAVSGHLARKKTETSYTKFLKFNELIQTEMGIRAEAPKQTALSALWRKRKLLLGLVGGRCRACGTPQIPKERVCVNPDCGAVDAQDDYEFADQPARVLTFTGDMLAVSVDPPAIYGMVQFDRGGRLLLDFTDCDLKDVEVGVPVRMSFRKKYYDDARGFTGYFWKAVPMPSPAQGT